MSFSNWIRNRKIGPAALRSLNVPYRCRLGLEPLEGRDCPSYSVVDLGSLGGSYYTKAHALNDAGQVVGQSDRADYSTHAFLWEDGVMTDLGDLGEGYSVAYDINDNGQAVGTAGFGGFWGGDADDPPPPDRPFLWQNGVMSDLMPDDQGWGRAYAINNAGVIVGEASTASGIGGAFVWENGGMYDLDSLLPAGGGVQLLRANDINDNGQITGLGSFNGYWAPFLLTDDDGIFANGGAVVTDLSGWGIYGEGAGLNNLGHVAGWMEFNGDGTNHAVLYSNGDVTDLVGDQATSDASAINEAGQVVGKNYVWSTSTGYRAFLWQNGEGTDLNYLIDSSFGSVLTEAMDINEGKAIVANSTTADRTAHAFLLIPSSLPSLSTGDVIVTEGNAGTVHANFTVTLSAASTETITVNYSTANGSAVSGSDYESASGALTFAPGETSKTFAVLVNGDTNDEFDETLSVALSGPTNAVLSRPVGMSTIVDDDPLPSLTIGDGAIIESNSGSIVLEFTLSLSAASGKTVSVNFASAGGTATAGSDFQAASGTRTIPAGQTTGTITILVNGDRLAEPNETFVVNLSSPTNAVITDGQGVGTIVDDEPRISISDVSKYEGKRGKTTLFTFMVTLSAAYDQAVTMSFSTVNGTATTGDGDYVASTGTLSFNPGETMKTITIEVKGDSKREADETFYLDLSGVSSNGLFTKSRGVAWILNDD